ncbi:AMP-binding protein [Flavobacterium sp. ALJ2]|uniref:AMP-binding protein n=1 Tax=Flavobacterium sp. ALJ2 TaxID=2786960 RepID=UPI0018A00C34|nr:AMP-binding protein [Flavobacterium sp. ALJ2]MBF7092200.1 AMP-binding protein [Flavobacterium sp. ALJ2]
MIRYFSSFKKAKLTTPYSIYILLSCLIKQGSSLITLLIFSAKKYSDAIALTDENEVISYKELSIQTKQLLYYLQNNHKLKQGNRVAIISKNHISCIKTIFALSGLGADIYLLSTEITKDQFDELEKSVSFDFIIYDVEKSLLLSNYKEKSLLAYGNYSVDSLSKNKVETKIKIKRIKHSRITTLTSGSTGNFKLANRKTSIINYIYPFCDLFTKLTLGHYKSIFIATPIYHGFGLATFFISYLLGSKIFLNSSFDQKKISDTISKNHIEVLSLVPVMLHRIIKQNSDSLFSLKCIISGGSVLSHNIVQQVFDKLGFVLYNLYGTSENGICTIATPADLHKYPGTIGKPINGLQIKIKNNSQKHIGEIYTKNNWSIKKNNWIKSGDLGYKNIEGFYFLSGRTDDMIISGGINVFPIELEMVLIQNHNIEQAYVIGIPDEDFGQRLKAYIQLIPDCKITQEELFDWLAVKIPKYHKPKQIEFITEIPYNAIGKIQKNKFVEKLKSGTLQLEV